MHAEYESTNKKYLGVGVFCHDMNLVEVNLADQTEARRELIHLMASEDVCSMVPEEFESFSFVKEGEPCGGLVVKWGDEKPHIERPYGKSIRLVVDGEELEVKSVWEITDEEAAFIGIEF